MWPSCLTGGTSCAAVDPNALTLGSGLTLLPFVAIFVTAHALATRHLFPRLADTTLTDGEDHVLPASAPAALRQAHAQHGARSTSRLVAAWAFGATIGLAATLGALILAEILGVVGAPAREWALAVTVPSLLFLLVLAIPWMECRSLVTGAGWSFQRNSRGRPPAMAWILHSALFATWLLAFYSVGRALPGLSAHAAETSYIGHITRACLERIGTVGICLMALLSGFASVSSPWHTFSPGRSRPVTDADINRKQGGLEATTEMLTLKRHRLQSIERRLASQPAPKKSTLGKVMTSIRGPSSAEVELSSLRMEISGLEAMEANLASNLSMLQNRAAAEARAGTPLGRILLLPGYLFSIYCVYRILATLLTSLRRLSAPDASFSNSDPINRFLALLARYWDPSLDQTAWARTISFALTGVILLASAGSVLQTFHLFARWTPGLLRHARANLALAVGQVAATYVISSSLLLRSHLPVEASSAVGGVLRGALSPSFVDGWFEGWFLLGSVVTAVGIALGRTLAGGDDWDEYGMEEMGAKRS